MRKLIAVKYRHWTILLLFLLAAEQMRYNNFSVLFGVTIVRLTVRASEQPEQRKLPYIYLGTRTFFPGFRTSKFNLGAERNDEPGDRNPAPLVREKTENTMKVAEPHAFPASQPTTPCRLNKRNIFPN